MYIGIVDAYNPGNLLQIFQKHACDTAKKPLEDKLSKKEV